MKQHIRRIGVSLYFFLFFSPFIFFHPAFAADVVSEDRGLTLEMCIAIALENHPDLAAGMGTVDSLAARIAQAAASGRTKGSLSPSYSYSKADGGSEQGQYSTSLTLNQSVYDWGKRDLKIGQATLNRDASLADVERVRDSVVRSVANAYYQFNRSERSVKIAKERLSNYETRLKWAKDFYSAGSKPKIEVSAAELDLANARLSLVSALAQGRTSVAQLASSMGVPEIVSVDLPDRLAFQKYEVVQDEALERALQNRPDLKSEQLRIEGVKKALTLAQKGMTPDLDASAGYSLSGKTDPTEKKDWRLQMGLSIPLWDGGLTKAQAAQARADLAVSEAKFEGTRQGVVLSVRESYVALSEAQEGIAVSLEAQRYAKERLDLAMGRFRAGVGNSLEVSDAIESFANSENSVVKSLYDCKVAQLNLEYAIGGMVQ